jgi:hypothetical protein
MAFLSNGSPCLNDDVISKKLNFDRPAAKSGLGHDICIYQ